jgi:hypothetical protein
MAYIGPTIPASGITFAQSQAAGASGHLEKLIAAMLAAYPTATPGTPTLTASGGGTTGGNLPAVPIFVKVTETNGIGETLASAEATVTPAAGNIPQVTFAALQAGATARNVYVGLASGAEVLYADGITTATYNLAAAIPTNSFAVPAPVANSTGLTTTLPAGASQGAPTFGPAPTVVNNRLALLRYCKTNQFQRVWDRFADAYRKWSQGEPIAFTPAIEHVRDFQLVVATMNQLASEFGALVDANPGHIVTSLNSIGEARTQRVWP